MTVSVSRSPIEIEKLYVQFKQTNADADLRNLIDTSTFFAESVGAPPAVKNHVTETVLNLQRDYEKGLLPPITEVKVVRMFNTIMQEAGAPDWAQTSVLQLREYRRTNLILEPYFLSERILKNQTNPKEISSQLSPIQAAHLLSQILIQKMVNADYQSNDPEWKVTPHPELAQKVKDAGGAFRECVKSEKITAMWKFLRGRGSDSVKSNAFIDAIVASLKEN